MTSSTKPKRRWLALLARLPWELLRRNPGVLILIFVIIAFNFLTSTQYDLGETRTPGWVFDTLPHRLGALLATPSVIVAIILIFCAKTLLDIAASQQMMHAFKRSSLSLLSSLRALRLNSVIWFVALELVIYVIYAVPAVSLYALAGIIWRESGVDLSVALLAIAAVLYPAFYGSIATAAMVAVFPTSSRQRFRTIGRLISRRSILLLYAYYAVRIFLELALLAVVPFLALTLLHNRILAGVGIAMSLLIPFVFLRGGSYSLSLQLLAADPQVRESFDAYFSLTRQEQTPESDT